MFLCLPKFSAKHGVVNGGLPTDNDAYDGMGTDRLDTSRRDVCGTAKNQETSLEYVIVVKLHDDYKRAQTCP